VNSAIKRLGDVHPLCCVHSALLDNCYDDVWSVFIDVAQQCRRESSIEVFNRFDSKSLQESLVAIFEEGLFDEFINIFFVEANSRLPVSECGSEALEVFRLYIVDLMEQFIAGAELGVIDFGRSYFYLYFKSSIEWFSTVSSLSAPFVIILCGLEAEEVTSEGLHKVEYVVDNSKWFPLSAMAGELHVENSCRGFLHVCACNVIGSLFAVLDGEGYFANANLVISYSRLWLKRNSGGLYSKYGDFVETWPDHAQQSLGRVMSVPDRLHVNWDHACLSLRYLGENLTSSGTRQFIDADLHSVIANCLKTAGGALSFNDIESKVGFPVEFDPLQLGPATRPGCIALYGRHQRFLTKEGAFFVLWEWIETEAEKKARIPRNRILSPLKVRDVEVGHERALEALESLSIWAKWGIAEEASLVTQLERMHFKEPLEGFYVRALGRHLRETLARDAVFIKGGVIISKFKFKDIFSDQLGLNDEYIMSSVWDRLMLEGDLFLSTYEKEVFRLLH